MSGLILTGLWFAGVAAVLGAAYLGVSAIFRDGTALGVRIVLAVIAVLVGQYLVGLALLSLGLFGLGALIAVLILSAAGVWRACQVPSVRNLVLADLGEVSESVRARPPSHRAMWLLALPAGIGWLTIVRATVTPPLDWDFFTYHGSRAAFWVQEGTLNHGYEAVGAWQIYRAFPIAGDLISAWSMLLPSGDVAVALTWAATWLAIGLVGYVAIRCLGGTRLNALLGAVVMLTIPGIFHHMSSGYVDNVVALALLAGVVCFAEAERARNPRLAMAAMAAWSLALATKLTALPFMAVGALLWTWLMLRDRAQIRLVPLAVGLSIIGVTALAWPVHLLLTLGNPVYPFGLSVFGLEFAGATAPARETGGTVLQKLDFLHAAAALFFGGFYRDPLLHNGFGPGGLLVVVTGAACLWTRGAFGRLTFIATSCTALLMLLWIVDTFIHYPGLDEARYIAIAAVLAAAAVGRMPGRWVSGLLGTAIAVNLVYALPWRWSVLDGLLVPACAAVGIVVALLISLPVFGRRSYRRAGAACALGSIVAALVIGPHAREMYFVGLGHGHHFNSGPMAFTASAQAFPVWTALAHADPLVVAVTAGTSDLPTHWYIYPLLGNRLQHRLMHVPTGLYYNDEKAAASAQDIDRAGQRWLAAIRESGADAVMLYAPDPVERRWIDANPQSFQLVAESREGDSALFRVIDHDDAPSFSPTARR